MTRPFIVFALFLALHSLTAVAQHPGSRRPSPPLDEAPKFDPKELGKKFGLPNCMYFPFHHRYDLFTAGEQKLVGKVSLDLSDKELRVRYSLDKCTIRAASIDITPKMFPVALPNRFPCKAKAVKGSHELHVVCPLHEFRNVPCCIDFFVYTQATLVCDKKKFDAYAGAPSCEGGGKHPGGSACNVITVHPPCPRHCHCGRKCICKKPDKSAAPSPAASQSSSPAASQSSSPAASQSSSPAASQSSSPAASQSSSPAASQSSSPSASQSSSPAASESSSPAASQSSSPSASQSSSPAASESSSPAASQSSSPSASQSSSPAASESSSPAASQSSSPSASPSSSLAASPTSSPSASPSSSVEPTPSPSATPCVCPNCFICAGVDANGNSICNPDLSTNDAECNPCEGGGNSFCQAAGLPNAFQCCPPTSNCKSEVIPTRLGVSQDSLEVTFICSRNCGATCDDIRNADGESNACSLFTAQPLNNDGDPDTDDLFDLCPDVSA